MPKFSGVPASLISAFSGKRFVASQGSGGSYDPVAGTGTFTTTTYTTGVLRFGGLDQSNTPGNSLGSSPVVLFSTDPNGKWMQAQESTVGSGWVKFQYNNRVILAINSSGELWGIGENSTYLPGGNNTWKQITGQGDSDTGWEDIAVGQGHWLAINSGKLYYMGRRDYAGGGSFTYGWDNWNQIGTDTDWEAVACGWQHSLAIKNGVLYAAGSNSNGRTGLGLTSGTTTDWTACTATNMVSATNNNFTFIRGGYDMSLAIQSGRAFYFGDLDTNEGAGMNLTTDQSVPVQIGQVGGTLQTDWVKGDISPYNNFLINTSGELYFAGESGQGVRGDGNSTTDAKAGDHIQIGTDTDWEEVQFPLYDFYGSCVVFKKGGKLQFAGRNIYGGILNSGSGTFTTITPVNGEVSCSAYVLGNDNNNTRNQVIGGFYT